MGTPKRTCHPAWERRRRHRGHGVWLSPGPGVPQVGHGEGEEEEDLPRQALEGWPGRSQGAWPGEPEVELDRQMYEKQNVSIRCRLHLARQ